MKKLCVSLLLVSLLLCGCARRQDAPEIPTTSYEEVEAIPNLACHISASDTDKTCELTGEIVYTLYRTVTSALALDSFDPNDPPPAPTDEPSVYVVFYVKSDGTDTEGSDESDGEYLTTATAHYGAFRVYGNGYTRFTLSPLHSNSYAYPVEDYAYGLLYSCLTVPTLEELTDFTCTVTHSDSTWVVNGEDAKELYRYISQNLRETEPKLNNTAAVSARLSFHTNDLEGLAGEYGCYSLYENGYIVFNPAPEVSSLFYYEVDGNVYSEIMVRLEVLKSAESDS